MHLYTPVSLPQRNAPQWNFKHLVAPQGNLKKMVGTPRKFEKMVGTPRKFEKLVGTPSKILVRGIHPAENFGRQPVGVHPTVNSDHRGAPQWKLGLRWGSETGVYVHLVHDGMFCSTTNTCKVGNLVHDCGHPTTTQTHPRNKWTIDRTYEDIIKYQTHPYHSVRPTQ